MRIRPRFWIALAIAVGVYMLSKTSTAQGWMAKLSTLLTHEEGERLTAYQDSGGAWTIGKGHLILPTDSFDGVKLFPYGPLKTITRAQSDALFAADTAKAHAAVTSSVNYPLTDNMLAALTSLAFNIGASAFKGSTLVKKLNAGDVQGAADEFPKWRMDNGEVNPVLVSRRAREQSLFLSA